MGVWEYGSMGVWECIAHRSETKVGGNSLAPYALCVRRYALSFKPCALCIVR